MLRDIYQEELEEEVSRELRGLLNNIFITQQMDIFLIYADYYKEPTRFYQICNQAKELGILEQICDEYNIEYIYQDYIINKDTNKFEKSFFKFIKKRQKIKKRSMDLLI